MDRLDMLRTFVAVADNASFAEAARRLRISPTAASRAVAVLEASLSTVLLRRTTRSVRTTAEGAIYLDKCRAVLADLDDAALALRGDAATPGGTLVVTAPVTFGRLHIVPIVTAMLRAHSTLRVELTLVDRVVRLVDEGIDVAVRIGDLSDSALYALKVAEVRRILVASPRYLAVHPAPAGVAGLHGHSLISFDELDRTQEWRFGSSGKPAIRVGPRLIVNAADAAISAAIDGLGIAHVLSYQALDAISSGQLVTLLDDLAPPPIPVHLIYQANRRTSVNVRAFNDAARMHFGRLDLSGRLTTASTRGKRKIALTTAIGGKRPLVRGRT
ncbi:LysR family transcriptional regulator [Sphingomonas sp. RB56-2]|uniref:LysR family transcriptional regulator n=1 Tax=Sphingomonas brevis TaxID=2908206 RepID=A0ABT0SAT5_9SPHN|nr:LysR family transcriptional regulator [Sphingomonas brevis]MCL6741447.1 LysR family transcriptional regulator [Sphingomonas brevis]